LPERLTPEQMLAIERRVLEEEDPEKVAHDLGLPPAVILRAADELIGPKDLKPRVERMAADFGYVGRQEFPFALAVGKTYTPDCVWFQNSVAPEAAVVIFEIEVGTSPKHRAGGVALANFVALSGARRLHFFAITPEKHGRLMANTIELFARHLQEKWFLNAFVIPSFSPAMIRQRLHAELDARALVTDPNSALPHQ
jgi:hypothetical protein